MRGAEGLKRHQAWEAVALGQRRHTAEPISRVSLVQLQAKARELLRKSSRVPLGVVTMLEADHEVISELHDDQIAAAHLCLD